MIDSKMKHTKESYWNKKDLIGNYLTKSSWRKSNQNGSRLIRFKKGERKGLLVRFIDTIVSIKM